MCVPPSCGHPSPGVFCYGATIRPRSRASPPPNKMCPQHTHRPFSNAPRPHPHPPTLTPATTPSPLACPKHSPSPLCLYLIQSRLPTPTQQLQQICRDRHADSTPIVKPVTSQVAAEPRSRADLALAQVSPVFVRVCSTGRRPRSFKTCSSPRTKTPPHHSVLAPPSNQDQVHPTPPLHSTPGLHFIQSQHQA